MALAHHDVFWHNGVHTKRLTGTIVPSTLNPLTDYQHLPEARRLLAGLPSTTYVDLQTGHPRSHEGSTQTLQVPNPPRPKAARQSQRLLPYFDLGSSAKSEDLGSISMGGVVARAIFQSFHGPSQGPCRAPGNEHPKDRIVSHVVSHWGSAKVGRKITFRTARGLHTPSHTVTHTRCTTATSLLHRMILRRRSRRDRSVKA